MNRVTRGRILSKSVVLENTCFTPGELIGEGAPPVFGRLARSDAVGKRRWLWVRAPPNPLPIRLRKSAKIAHGSNLAGGEAQFDEQFYIVGCCYLLLFFRVTLGELTFLIPDWGTFKVLYVPIWPFPDTDHPSRLEKPAYAPTGHTASSVPRLWRPLQTKSRDSRSRFF